MTRVVNRDFKGPHCSRKVPVRAHLMILLQFETTIPNPLDLYLRYQLFYTPETVIAVTSERRVNPIPDQLV